LLQYTLFWEITTITPVSSWPWTKWICLKTVRKFSLRTYVNDNYASRLIVLYDCPTRVFLSSILKLILCYLVFNFLWMRVFHPNHFLTVRTIKYVWLQLSIWLLPNLTNDRKHGLFPISEFLINTLWTVNAGKSHKIQIRQNCLLTSIVCLPFGV